jgi:cytochrome c oxidase accessory protein FixG
MQTNPTENHEEWVSMFQSDQKIVPRSVSGRFSRLRWLMVFFTQVLFYGMAWLQYNGRQALLFDLDARRFFIGPLVLYPQDFIYFTALLVVCALSLFLFTAVAGRLWCGYACPQTVYTEMFMWVERKIEGDRNARLKLQANGWSTQRICLTLSKHTVWLAMAMWTGLTFVGYFTPIRPLFEHIDAGTVAYWQVFWIVFYGFATYGNAGFMREQVCKYMCPYARFQSAMFDKDTLLVTYDEQRGEPRGSRSKKTDAATTGLGACIDCNLCVQVCPTGIDIRKGLQYECIGCAACIDVCDSVMDKMNYPRGLVRYSTQNGIAKHWGHRQILAAVLRPRVLIYTAVLWTLIAVVGWALVSRPVIKMDVVRDRNVQYRQLDDGSIENVYRVLLMNTSEQAQQVSLSVHPQQSTNTAQWALSGATQWTLEPIESRWVVVHVQAPEDAIHPGSNSFRFDLLAQPENEHILESSVLIAPR